jgi:hypothetical protein
MLIDYLLAITAVTVLKVQKSQTAPLLFYQGQVGLFSPVVV